jgi:hypothetical protein
MRARLQENRLFHAKRRGHARPGRVETGIQFNEESFETNEPTAAHRRDAYAPLQKSMSCMKLV